MVPYIKTLLYTKYLFSKNGNHAAPWTNPQYRHDQKLHQWFPTRLLEKIHPTSPTILESLWNISKCQGEIYQNFYRNQSESRSTNLGWDKVPVLCSKSFQLWQIDVMCLHGEGNQTFASPDAQMDQLISWYQDDWLKSKLSLVDSWLGELVNPKSLHDIRVDVSLVCTWCNHEGLIASPKSQLNQ